MMVAFPDGPVTVFVRDQSKMEDVRASVANANRELPDSLSEDKLVICELERLPPEAAQNLEDDRRQSFAGRITELHQARPDTLRPVQRGAQHLHQSRNRYSAGSRAHHLRQ